MRHKVKRRRTPKVLPMVNTALLLHKCVCEEFFTTFNMIIKVHNTLSLKVVNDSTDTLCPLCVTFVSLCTIGGKVM